MIPNLDAMSPEELESTRTRYARLARRHPKAAPVAWLLWDYCITRHRAHLARLSGLIPKAIRLDGRCDRIYADLAKLAPVAVW